MKQEREFYSDFERKLYFRIKDDFGTPAFFASVIDVSRSLFNKIFDNGIKSVRRDTREKIANGLSLKFDEFERGNFETLITEPIEPVQVQLLSTDPLNPLEKELLTAFRELSVSGQFKVVEYVSDIKEKYRKE